jgi:tetratricopeptide (TPR) repeat protein
MAPLNSKIADDLLASAHDSAVHDGVRLAAGRYIEAVDALVLEQRSDEAMNVLAELLAAREKKRGFFLGKREQSPLGDQRQAVAKKYAQLALGAAPTENSLDILNQLAVEFPDAFEMRVANANALRQAGYLLDALDEYRYARSLHGADVDLDVTLGELFCQLGRPDEAVTHAKDAIAQSLRSGNESAAADLAVRMLSFAPDAFEESIDAFASMSAPSLLKVRPQAEAVAAIFQRGDVKDASRRSALATRLEQLRERLEGKLVPPGPPQAQATKPKPVAQAEAVAQPAAPATAPMPAPEPEPALTAPPKRPAAAGGLSAFAKRKALELFANSEYEAAIGQLERVVRMSPDVEALEMLLECYLVLDRHSEAARVGVLLADAEVAAGNRPGAIAALTSLSKKIADPAVEQRRVELMQNK